VYICTVRHICQGRTGTQVLALCRHCDFSSREHWQMLRRGAHAQERMVSALLADSMGLACARNVPSFVANQGLMCCKGILQ
jgi:hypothetical protein